MRAPTHERAEAREATKQRATTERNAVLGGTTGEGDSTHDDALDRAYIEMGRPSSPMNVTRDAGTPHVEATSCLAVAPEHVKSSNVCHGARTERTCGSATAASGLSKMIPASVLTTLTLIDAFIF
jgi:hypothetical protein